MTDPRWRRPARRRVIDDGVTRLIHIPDGELQLDPMRWFGSAAPPIASELLDDEGMLVAGIGALVVERPSSLIMIDAGAGPIDRVGDPSGLTGRWRGGSLLDELRRTGIEPADIDLVALTHLHVDHSGWLLDPTGLRAFSRARVAVSRREWDDRALRVGADVAAQALEALAPRLELVDDGQTVAPGVTARLAPGHTSGHTVFEIAFGTGRVLVLGDAMHSPVQIEHSAREAAADEDPAAGVTTRRALIDRLGDEGTIGYAVHFADVVFGRVVTEPEGRDAWQPIDARAL